ncbi:hypothetical protein RI129_009221 [Pyrocoelia pectoralis]|uniref:Uncharacterized protein n=1 Tax=Pyrocoelia pectoralis TaxID=417401 RepID=A0AAN7VGZ0_9COLE
MLSDKVEYDVNSEFEDNNYKSCFARSIVVNSQHQQEQHVKRQLQNQGIEANRGESTPFVLQTNTKDCFGNGHYVSDSRRSSACSSRIAEMPIENLLLKSQIDTLQWQLKQTESSKEMYREVMVQVVKFLERAYRSLQILGSKVPSNQSVSRAQSDYHMNEVLDCNVDKRRSTIPAIDAHLDYTAFRDFTWRRQKKPQQPPDEIPPEKLSQEAFRLLRTAQSLLNTTAPDLAQLNNDTSEDIKFLEQLAKEFPRVQENGTHRPASRCSSSLQICAPDKEIRISTAFNRKLSLRQNLMSKRNSFHLEMLPSSTLNDDSRNSQKSFTIDNKNRKFKLESSPPMSSVSSAEDESGFSSMNSFQELGIPLINSTVAEEVKEPCTNTSVSSKTDYELWQTPDSKPIPTNHKRWNSTPTDTDKPLKVLWV